MWIVQSSFLMLDLGCWKVNLESPKFFVSYIASVMQTSTTVNYTQLVSDQEGNPMNGLKINNALKGIKKMAYLLVILQDMS